MCNWFGNFSVGNTPFFTFYVGLSNILLWVIFVLFSFKISCKGNIGYATDCWLSHCFFFVLLVSRRFLLCAVPHRVHKLTSTCLLTRLLLTHKNCYLFQVNKNIFIESTKTNIILFKLFLHWNGSASNRYEYYILSRNDHFNFCEVPLPIIGFCRILTKRNIWECRVEMIFAKFLHKIGHWLF